MKSATRIAALTLALLPMACAPDPIPDHAFLQSAAPFGSNQDPQTAAIVVGAWTLASPARSANNPLAGARAIAAVDYMAGDLYANPRWEFISPTIKQQMLQARGEVRSAVGIAPNAPSQEVVDSLLSVAAAQAVANAPAVYASLQSPVFTRPPEQTYAALTNLPPLPIANVATQHLNSAINGPGDRRCFPCG
ncbi:MAG TPA: hypothetical protein VHS58_23120 [Acetobacteraceae bacterium]|jgi:hypothetical protein|nr:hypothetical protein [Acetobacteraceae bacterium]